MLGVPTVFTAGNHDTAPEKYIEHLNVPVTNNAAEMVLTIHLIIMVRILRY